MRRDAKVDGKGDGLMWVERVCVVEGKKTRSGRSGGMDLCMWRKGFLFAVQLILAVLAD